MPEMNYSAIYFLMENSMDRVHSMMDQLHGHGQRGPDALGHSSYRSTDLRLRFYESKGYMTI
jgi:hypothetical protein